MKWFLAMSVCVVAIPTVSADGKQKFMPSLEDAFRAWQTGLLSEQKIQRDAAVRSMWTLTKKDVQILFPTQAEKIWPHIEKMNRTFMEQADEIAKEKAEYGPVVRVTAIDVRKKENVGELLIPAHVPVFEYAVELERGAWNGGPCVYVDGRWIWIIDLPQEVHEILQGK